MTSAAFNQNPSRAKKDADKQPLVITEHGEASDVLVTYADFTTNWRKSKTLTAIVHQLEIVILTMAHFECSAA